MSVQTYLLIGCLQISLWLFRGHALGEPAVFSTMLLGMYLWYRCLNAVSGGSGRLERNARFWALAWLLLQACCLLVPAMFGVEGWPPETTARSFLFALPCLFLYLIPVIPAEFQTTSDQPGNNW